MRRFIVLLILVVSAAVALSQAAVPSRAGTDSASCGARPYSYAGVIGRRPAAGIAATLQLDATPTVEHGHVAAWVGVGGVGMGVNGADEWLQAGLAGLPSSGSALYYEVAQPNAAPRYVELQKNVALGESHRIAVIEVRAKPNWWRVWVDRVAVTPAIFLPASHNRWAPVATSENWNGGVGACNSFQYRFASVNTRHLDWTPIANPYRLQDPGYRLESLGASSLVATGGPTREIQQVQAP